MKVTIAKVDQNLFSGDAISLTLPGSAGELTVLSNHAPLITTLNAGTVTVRTKEGEQTFAIEGGVLEVSRNEAVVVL